MNNKTQHNKRRNTMSELIKFEEVEKKVITIREQQVLLDRDVAELYGVETKDINRAVKNNPEKFPERYIFSLCENEKSEVVKNFHHLSMLKFSHALPTAFTEKGLYMLATILKSPIATQTTLAIVETFTKIREFARIMTELPNVKEESEQKELIIKSGNIFADILEDNIMEITDDEITLELNLAAIKLKRKIKRKKK